MAGFFDYGVPLIGLLLQATVVVCSLFRREFLRYLPLNIYMLCLAITDGGLYLLIQRYGVTSHQYFYAYYTADLLLCVAMYSVVIHLYRHTLGDTSFKPYLRGGAVLLLTLTCLFSYLVVRRSQGTLTARFASELEQNLNFVGVVLTYLLFAAIMKRRETPTRLVQLVLTVGIYFSAIAATYAVRSLYPQIEGSNMWMWAPPLIGLWVPAASCYAFLTVSNEAKLPMSRLASAVPSRIAMSAQSGMAVSAQ
jgi:hypothetical protein